jgi:hypothetical protein
VAQSARHSPLSLALRASKLALPPAFLGAAAAHATGAKFNQGKGSPMKDLGFEVGKIEVLTVSDILSYEGPDTFDLQEALKTYAATALDADPLYKRFEKPPAHVGKVLWMGRQWVVTEDGVECMDHHYPVEKDRLWEGEKDQGWVKHMFAKPWVDPADFAEALRIARHLHGQ